MRNKLLIVSVVAMLGLVGCNKEEEAAAISPGVEKAQSGVTEATTPASVPVATEAQVPTNVETNTMPTASVPSSVAPQAVITDNTKVVPVASPATQASTQLPEPANVVPQNKLDATSQTVVYGVGDGQGQAQPTLTSDVISASSPASIPVAADQKVAAKVTAAVASPVEVVDTTKIKESVTTVVNQVPEVKTVSGVNTANGVNINAAPSADSIPVAAAPHGSDSAVLSPHGK